VASVAIYSCKPAGPDHNWDRFVTDGDTTKEIEPIVLGDGTVIVMTANVNGETFADGSDANKKCPLNSETNCTKYGGSFTLDNLIDGKNIDDVVKEQEKLLDTDGDGINDIADELKDKVSDAIAKSIASETDGFVNAVVSSGEIMTVAEDAATKLQASLAEIDPSLLLSSKDYATTVDKLNATVIDKLLSSDGDELKLRITDEVVDAVAKAVDGYIEKHPIFIDEEEIFDLVNETVKTVIQDLLQDFIQSAIEEKVLAIIKDVASDAGIEVSEKEADDVAKTVAEESSQGVGSDPAEQVAGNAGSVAQTEVGDLIYEQGTELPEVQSVCPEGKHLPSDKEWKKIELSLGMPAFEVHLSGMRADRGASKELAKTFKDKFALQYAGYGTESGSYAQIDEVCVLATSSVGFDSIKGSYIWVRYIVNNSEDYKGIVRQKQYKGTTVSVRCIGE